MKGELAVMKGTLERFVELAAKDATEHLAGKKEVVAWFDPARVIDRQAAGGHHAMYMRVKFEFLTPGMQHAEEANLCAMRCTEPPDQNGVPNRAGVFSPRSPASMLPTVSAWRVSDPVPNRLPFAKMHPAQPQDIRIPCSTERTLCPLPKVDSGQSPSCGLQDS